MRVYEAVKMWAKDQSWLDKAKGSIYVNNEKTWFQYEQESGCKVLYSRTEHGQFLTIHTGDNQSSRQVEMLAAIALAKADFAYEKLEVRNTLTTIPNTLNPDGLCFHVWTAELT